MVYGYFFSCWSHAAREAVEKELAGKAATVEVSAKESDMEKVIAEQAAVGKSESDATVNEAEGARIDNECEDIVDEFCPDEDFNVETGDHVVENSEVFKISFSDKGWSKMNENQIFKEMELSF